MKNSLKNQLNKILQEKGELEWRQIVEWCDTGYFGQKYKVSTAEKKLRELHPDAVGLDEFGNETSQFNCNPIVKYVWRGEPAPKPQRYFINDPQLGRCEIINGKPVPMTA